MAGGLSATGLDDVAAHLRGVGESQALVDAAMIEHGRQVTADAVRIAPRRTGALQAAITSTYSPTAGLVVDAGAARVPYAYTFHAVALGKSGGYMTFRLPSFTRRGAQVKAHGMIRPIKNLPYLFTAWKAKETALTAAVEEALTEAVHQ